MQAGYENGQNCYISRVKSDHKNPSITPQQPLQYYVHFVYLLHYTATSQLFIVNQFCCISHVKRLHASCIVSCFSLTASSQIIHAIADWHTWLCQGTHTNVSIHLHVKWYCKSCPVLFTHNFMWGGSQALISTTYTQPQQLAVQTHSNQLWLPN